MVEGMEPHHRQKYEGENEIEEQVVVVLVEVGRVGVELSVEEVVGRALGEVVVLEGYFEDVVMLMLTFPSLSLVLRPQ